LGVGREPQDDPRVRAIAAARELVEKRDRWLNPPADDRPPTMRRPYQMSSVVSRPSSAKDNRIKPPSSVVGGL